MKVEKVGELNGHKGSIYKIAKGKNKDLILTFGGDGQVVEWNLETMENGILRAKSEYKFFSGLYHRDSDACFAGDMNGSVYRLLFQQKENNISAWKTHLKGVFDLVEANDFIFSSGGDGTVTRWALDPFRPLETREVSPERMRSLLWDENRGLMLAGSTDGGIYILDPHTLRTVDLISNAHDSTVFSMKLVPDNKLLVSGGRDAFLNFWTYPDMELAHRIPAHLFTINDLALSPCGRWLASAGRDKEVRIWDLSNYQLLKVIDRLKYKGHSHSVNAVHWDLETGLLCTAGDDNALKIWRITEDKGE
nr:hypothetical protein [Saprospiraceae bacterium]